MTGGRQRSPQNALSLGSVDAAVRGRSAATAIPKMDQSQSGGRSRNPDDRYIAVPVPALQNEINDIRSTSSPDLEEVFRILDLPLVQLQAVEHLPIPITVGDCDIDRFLHTKPSQREIEGQVSEIPSIGSLTQWRAKRGI